MNDREIEEDLADEQRKEESLYCTSMGQVGTTVDLHMGWVMRAHDNLKADPRNVDLAVTLHESINEMTRLIAQSLKRRGLTTCH